MLVENIGTCDKCDSLCAFKAPKSSTERVVRSMSSLKINGLKRYNFKKSIIIIENGYLEAQCFELSGIIFWRASPNKVERGQSKAL